MRMRLRLLDEHGERAHEQHRRAIAYEAAYLFEVSWRVPHGLKGVVYGLSKVGQCINQGAIHVENEAVVTQV